MDTFEHELNAAAARLREAHGGIWGEHPDWPVADWRAEVANDDTRLGYWAWVVHEIEVRDENKEAGDG